MKNPGITHSQYLKDEDIKKLHKKAQTESLDAKIELAALEVEDGHDVEKNLAFLDDMAEKENILALMDLYFIFQSSDEDEEKSLSYIEKAASLGSPWAMEGLAIRAMIKRISSDEKDLTEEHFLEEEKWRLAAYEASKTPKNDLAPSGVVLNMEELAALYENKNPENPLFNPEKAAEWKAKAKEAEKTITR